MTNNSAAGILTAILFEADGGAHYVAANGGRLVTPARSVMIAVAALWDRPSPN